MAEQHNKERWTSWLALSTAIMAVLAAITTLYMGKFSTRAVLLQGQESNQWAFYQAKSIKQHTYEMQKERLDLDIAGGKMPAIAVERYQQVIEKYTGEIQRYETEKKEIKAKAEGLAKQKEKSQFMGGNFGYSLIFLQIAIMLSSIATLTKRHYLWYIGLSANCGWLFFFLNAMFDFF